MNRLEKVEKLALDIYLAKTQQSGSAYIGDCYREAEEVITQVERNRPYEPQERPVVVETLRAHHQTLRDPLEGMPAYPGKWFTEACPEAFEYVGADKKSKRIYDSGFIYERFSKGQRIAACTLAARRTLIGQGYAYVDKQFFIEKIYTPWKAGKEKIDTSKAQSIMEKLIEIQGQIDLGFAKVQELIAEAKSLGVPQWIASEKLPSTLQDYVTPVAEQIEPKSSEFDKWFAEQVGVQKGIGSDFYFLYNGIHCKASIHLEESSLVATIKPLGIKDDIGNGAGSSVQLTFKRDL